MRPSPICVAVAVTAVSLAVAFPSAARAWGSVRGNGHKTTEQRTVAAFRSVALEGSLDVEVKVGPAQSVAVTIDDNLLPEVETRVERETLVIGTRREIRATGVAKVSVTVPALSAFSIDGSGDATVEGAQGGDVKLSIEGSGDLRFDGKAGRMDVEISGSGDVHLSGAAEALRVRVEGSGDVDASHLSARSADASIDGSGDVELTLAGGTLDAEVSGSGSVTWRGEAQLRRAEVSGSGEISRR